MKKSHQQQVLKYFKDKAGKYDLVEHQIYWRFSDKLLWLNFVRLLKTLPKDFRFLDAGGGTGRWSFKILNKFPSSSGIIYDLSDEMLNVAKENAKKLAVVNRLKILKGNLANIDKSNLKENPVNVCFNFHNVLGFVTSPRQIIKKLSLVIKRDGYLVSFVPNLYHLIYFNISMGRIKKAESACLTKKGRFTDQMPGINLFTPDTISEIYRKAGLEITNLTGFPTVLYPGYLETQIEGSTRSLSNLLKIKKNFESLIKIEESITKNKDISARGNNIYIVGKKI